MKIQWNYDHYAYGDPATDTPDTLETLVGETLVSVEGLEKYSEEIVITTESGKAIKLHHIQDCCECVNVEDFECDVEDFEGALVLSAEEVDGGHVDDQDGYESATWTFYKIETDRGGLFIRWLGESNGYYSESVDVTGGKVIN